MQSTTDDWYRKLKEEQAKEEDALEVEAILDGMPFYWYWLHPEDVEDKC